jgi:hypothetical protein
MAWTNKKSSKGTSMTKDEALKLALKALGNTWTEPKSEQYKVEKEAITAIKEALALQKRNRTSVLSSRMTEESEKESNRKANEDFADLLFYAQFRILT